MITISLTLFCAGFFTTYSAQGVANLPSPTYFLILDEIINLGLNPFTNICVDSSATLLPIHWHQQVNGLVLMIPKNEAYVWQT